MKFLLLVTTHLSNWHVKLMSTCWRKVVQASSLIRDGDVLVYATAPPSREFLDLFRHARVVVHKNIGYHTGAMFPLIDSEQRNLTRHYDWVMRVNPDVILKNDTWIRQQMDDKQISGIFTDCFSRQCTRRRCVDHLIHSDFLAFRPRVLSASSFLRASQNKKYVTAEQQTTASMRSIVRRGEDAWLKGTRQKGFCRVQHRDIVHTHSVRDLASFCSVV